MWVNWNVGKLDRGESKKYQNVGKVDQNYGEIEQGEVKWIKTRENGSRERKMDQNEGKMSQNVNESKLG